MSKQLSLLKNHKNTEEKCRGKHARKFCLTFSMLRKTLSQGILRFSVEGVVDASMSELSCDLSPGPKVTSSGSPVFRWLIALSNAATTFLFERRLRVENPTV